ncbi:hypothetical protein ACFFGR_16560 [Arthrobacter liuii]|uniref:HprK-related kinase A n=1 Tax=Arthrobacter liuii TaxID=1476996 RepID=A0ABQ2AV36_9MICC|nr:hypothetical protein [Arthrobacter liuii]GGH98137.1 hypothetical protein GCM10007170_29990 [Arthrobacter liuii]
MSGTNLIRLSPSRHATSTTFDVHGLVAIHVEAGTPGEDQLRDMLAPFIGDSSASLQLQVSGTTTEFPAQSHAEDAYRYTDTSLFLPADRVQVIQTPNGYRVEGRGELLTAVVPLLDRLCVRAETAMVHAAMVNYKGAGVLLPAWGGVGKTSTVAKLLAVPGVGFMADDWGFFGADGMLSSYAKPMFIKPHHRSIYPDLFQGSRKPLAPGWLIPPLSRAATAVHPVIVRYPRTASFTRRWSPEHRMVHPEEVFGPENISSSAPARLAIFLERFDGVEAEWEPRSVEWMTSRIVGNFHSELPLVSRRLIEALGATGLVPLDDYFGQKAEIISSALKAVPCSRLRLPITWSADRASDYVSKLVRSQLDT